MATVLLADKLPQECVDVLEQAGLTVVNKPGLSPEELKDAIKGVEGVVVRSGVKLTADILAAADSLKAAVRAGVGVDNIDVDAASRMGIVVMNTPGANTISTAEHAFALMLALSRNVGPAYVSMRAGRWDRKKFVGAELARTTLGIVGLGRVGRAVATRAVAFGMKVIGHDPYISHEAAGQLGVQLRDTLEDVLKACDYLTVHVPGGDETKSMIGADEIALMKPTARIINCARGEVVDMAAVVEAVKDDRLAGAAFDVYKPEPPEDSGFAGDDRILATPHLGASTEAAQIAVGTQAAEQVADAILHEDYRNALNVAPVPPEEMAALAPFCELAWRLGQIAGVLNRGRTKSVDVLSRGELARHTTTPIVNNGVLGVLKAMLGNTVNIVSAPHLARERGIKVTSTASLDQQPGFTDLVTLKLVTDAGELEVAGTVFGGQHQRVVRVGSFYTEVAPEGELLLVFGADKPGVIGMVGKAVGAAGVNIARMTFGRTQAGGESLLALNLDDPCSQKLLDAVNGLSVVGRAVLVSLR